MLLSLVEEVSTVSKGNATINKCRLQLRYWKVHCIFNGDARRGKTALSVWLAKYTLVQKVVKLLCLVGETFDGHSRSDSNPLL